MSYFDLSEAFRQALEKSEEMYGLGGFYEIKHLSTKIEIIRYKNEIKYIFEFQIG